MTRAGKLVALALVVFGVAMAWGTVRASQNCAEAGGHLARGLVWYECVQTIRIR